jgi:hypothetical protein
MQEKRRFLASTVEHMDWALRGEDISRSIKAVGDRANLKCTPPCARPGDGMGIREEIASVAFSGSIRRFAVPSGSIGKMICGMLDQVG